MINIVVYGKPRAFESHEYGFDVDNSTSVDNSFPEPILKPKKYQDLVVFTSIPFLFLSGISWPQSAIPPFWLTVGSILPSTYAIRGFVRMASMGATLADVLAEFRALWIQAGIYLVFASFVMRRKGNPKKS